MLEEFLTTDFEGWLEDQEWWFPPQRIHLEAHDDIKPMALYNKLENPELLPDYSKVPHGSAVELIPVLVLEEALCS